MALGYYVSDQLVMFLRAILLGMALGLVYDLVRTVRTRGGKLLENILDALYCFSAVLAVFCFTMAEGGELRLFVLAGALGGAVLFFCTISQPLRPIWSFWLDILLVPFQLAGRMLKKWGKQCKKLFSFLRRYRTIMYMRVRMHGHRSRAAEQRGEIDGQNTATSEGTAPAGESKEKAE